MVIINNLFLKKKKNELHFFIMLFLRRIIKIADLNVIILIYIKRKKKKKKIHIFFVTCVKGLIGEIKDKIFFLKMAKKSKKSAGDNINAKLQLVMKSGKYQFGRKSCLKALRTGKGI
ncbi:hypothetical protein PFTANZ_02946 [Plasmodium falciparum Tanzania (2000708)]|uniref:Uncharacterized protein n=1 Tax=Plasmodium falciparum Tanzania (2000708) TaxID=1036725 RepID=A0A024W695_PLAFA|nr:hypothetical protein PFTANZ_02946 [Plasmodium falciparum Tanzania (2000708)]